MPMANRLVPLGIAVARQTREARGNSGTQEQTSLATDDEARAVQLAAGLTVVAGLSGSASFFLGAGLSSLALG